MSEEFSISEYINKALIRVEDEGERKRLETVLNGVFKPLQQHMEKKYEQLTEAICSEAVKENDGYELYTALVPKKNFDLSVSGLFPMDEKDLEERTVETRKVLGELEMEGRFFLYQVVANCDYLKVKELEHAKRRFRGKVLTDEDEYEAFFMIEPERKYQDYVKNLYYAFIDNGLEWKTICAPYLFRIFRVFLIETDCPEEENIQEIQVDFEEYDSVFLRDMVPVWNIRKQEETTSAYPVPCVDKMHFQHVIYKHRLHEESKYLPVAREVQIVSLKTREGDLVITCGEEEPKHWELYEITGLTKQPEMFEIFYNGIRRKGFLKSSLTNGIRTRAELFHFISMLGYEEYMRLDDVTVKEGTVETDTYFMDPFIEDEIRTSKNGDSLILHFIPVQLGRTLNYDIMSYLVSRVQWYYPDYHCVGTFGGGKRGEGL